MSDGVTMTSPLRNTARDFCCVFETRDVTLVVTQVTQRNRCQAKHAVTRSKNYTSFRVFAKLGSTNPRQDAPRVAAQIRKEAM